MPPETANQVRVPLAQGAASILRDLMAIKGWNQRKTDPSLLTWDTSGLILIF
jgi:hypothetical protein